MIIFEFDKKIINWLEKLNQEAKKSGLKQKPSNDESSILQEDDIYFSWSEVLLMTMLGLGTFVFCWILYNLLL